MKTPIIFLFAYAIYYFVASNVFGALDLGETLSSWLVTYIPVMVLIFFAARDVWKRSNGG